MINFLLRASEQRILFFYHEAVSRSKRPRYPIAEPATNLASDLAGPSPYSYHPLIPPVHLPTDLPTCPAPMRRPSVTSVIAIRGCWRPIRGTSLCSLPRTAGSDVNRCGAIQPRASSDIPRNPLHASVSVATRHAMERATFSFLLAMYLIRRNEAEGKRTVRPN